MKIIFLNTLNGQVRDKMTEYIQQQALDTDIFCFQETFDEMESLSNETLKDYTGIFADKFVTKDDDFRQAMYYKQDVAIISSGTILKDQDNCGLGQYIEIQRGSESLYVCNFHGMSRPGSKLDDASRISQSQGLIEFFKDKQHVIIGGDFNLLPETKSVGMFEEHGYKDLIKDFNIPTTRNELIWALYPDNKQYFSDYIFTTPDIQVTTLNVPDNRISDHLPLELVIQDER